MSHPKGYSTAQIALHWLTAICVLIAFFTHDAMEELADTIWRAGGDPVPSVHTIAGFAVFVLVLARLWLRRRRGAPEPEGSELIKLAAHWGHRLLYALMIAVPLMGAAMWFGGQRWLDDVHGLAGKGMMLVALGHAVMAIFHQVVKKDGTLSRMLRPQ